MCIITYKLLDYHLISLKFNQIVTFLLEIDLNITMDTTPINIVFSDMIF